MEKSWGLKCWGLEYEKENTKNKGIRKNGNTGREHIWPNK